MRYLIIVLALAICACSSRVRFRTTPYTTALILGYRQFWRIFRKLFKEELE